MTTRSKHVGYVAELWKVVKENGVEKERTRVNKSTYQASAKKVTIGVAGASDYQIMSINAALATGDDATVTSAIHSLGVPLITSFPVAAPAN